MVEMLLAIGEYTNFVDLMKHYKREEKENNE